MIGYRRADGRHGIRNLAVVVYLVECARHVVDKIVAPFDDDQVHAIGFSGCFRNEYSAAMMERLCTHPNVGAVLLVSLGCEGFDREPLEQAILDSGRPVSTLVIQRDGGSLSTIAAGRIWIEAQVQLLADVIGEPIGLEHLVVGTICGGSDATSGLTANPAVGVAIDAIVAAGGTAIFEETGELVGCEEFLQRRAVTPELGDALAASVRKAASYYDAMGQPSFAPGNADGGITTIEEKSLGAYLKSGTSPIRGLLKPADLPSEPGLYMLDVVPDGDLRWGFPNISDNAEIGELMACGAQLILFTTGRGSVVGSAIAPVVKICANPETFGRMVDDMDVNAGRMLTDHSVGVADVGAEILDTVQRTASGRQTASEVLGHREFVMTYKSFDPSGDDAQPVVARRAR